MKKLLMLLLAVATLVSCCSCSQDEERFHYDLIAKYDTNGGKYYTATYKGIQVEDFGTKYDKDLYDVSLLDGKLQYFYAYEGDIANDEGIKDMENYMKYLDETFGFSQEQTDKWNMFSYPIDNEHFIHIMKFQMADAGGIVLMVSIPSDVTATSDNSQQYDFKYSSLTSEYTSGAIENSGK